MVEAGGAEGVAGPGGVGEAGVLEELEHAGWAGEALDRGGKVAVGAGLPEMRPPSLGRMVLK